MAKGKFAKRAAKRRHDAMVSEEAALQERLEAEQSRAAMADAEVAEVGALLDRLAGLEKTFLVDPEVLTLLDEADALVMEILELREQLRLEREAREVQLARLFDRRKSAASAKGRNAAALGLMEELYNEGLAPPVGGEARGPKRKGAVVLVGVDERAAKKLTAEQIVRIQRARGWR
jgi:hypothetical protein